MTETPTLFIQVLPNLRVWWCNVLTMNKLLGLLTLIMLCVLCSVQRSTSTYRTKNQMSFHKAPLIADLEVGEKILRDFLPAFCLLSRCIEIIKSVEEHCRLRLPVVWGLLGE